MSTDAVADARERLLALKARFDAGTLAPSDYERERRAVERALGEAVVAPVTGSGAARPSRRLVAGLAVLVVAAAVVGYAFTGRPSMTGLAAASKPPPVDAAALAAGPSASGAAGDPRQTGLQQIAAMVDSLAARMKERPDDGEGWTMLARSYTVLGRFGEAVPAYAKAAALQPANAGLLADYADAVAAQKGTVGNPETLALIDRALAADPKHPKALALAGTAAYDRGDFAVAVARWQKIADTLPAGSELLAQVQASIGEAKERMGGGVAAQAPAAGAIDSPAGAGDGTRPAAADASAVAGTVSLEPSLAAKASPGDTVFVFARAAEGPRMPLAVKRATVADLPLAFQLDDSMAMSPAARLSGARSVVVGARISKSGNALPQPGDLSGESKPVAPGTRGITVRIVEVAAPR